MTIDNDHEEQKDHIRQPEGWSGEVDALHSLCQLPRLEEARCVRHRYRPAEDHHDAAAQGHGALRRSRGALRHTGFRRARSRHHAAAHGLGLRHRGLRALRLAGQRVGRRACTHVHQCRLYRLPL